MQQSQSNKTGIDFDRVRAVIEPLLRAHGLLLVDLEWGTEQTGWVLRVFIEREHFIKRSSEAGTSGSSPNLSGVTLEDCSRASLDLSNALDVADLIRHHYHLEVSSPGLDRKLYSRSDFERFEGETAKLKLRRAAPDGQKVLRGKLVRPPSSAPKGQVAVIADGKLISVPYEDVEEARLVFELSPQPKMKKGMGKASKSPKAKPAPETASGLNDAKGLKELKQEAEGKNAGLPNAEKSNKKHKK